MRDDCLNNSGWLVWGAGVGGSGGVLAVKGTEGRGKCREERRGPSGEKSRELVKSTGKGLGEQWG